MKNHARRVLSFILCLVMCVSLFPTAAFATGVETAPSDGTPQVPAEQTPTESMPVPTAQTDPAPESTPAATPEVTPSVTPEPTPAATPEVTPEPTPWVTPDPTDEPEGDPDEYGIAPTALGDDDDTTPTAEDALQQALDAATDFVTYPMSESVTLTKDFTVSAKKVLAIPNGITLTVPAGTKLTNSCSIVIEKGGSLVVDAGGTLESTDYSTIELMGGSFTINGSFNKPENVFAVNLYVSADNYADVAAMAAATNYPVDNINAVAWAESNDEIQRVLALLASTDYNKIQFDMQTAVTLANTTIPTGKVVNFQGTSESRGTITVPSGVTFTNNGSLLLANCDMVVSKGGTYTGISPYYGEQMDSTYTDQNIVTYNVASMAELKTAIADTDTSSIRITGAVTVDEDITVPAAVGLDINGGSLTIATGKTLTATGPVIMQTNTSALTVSEGATLVLKDPADTMNGILQARVSVNAGSVTNNGTITLQTADGQTITGRPAVIVNVGEDVTFSGNKSVAKLVTYGAEDMNALLSSGYGWYQLYTVGDISVAADMTIPTNVSLELYGYADGTKCTVTIPNGVTVTNNGSLYSRCDIVVEVGGKIAGSEPTFATGATLTDKNTTASAEDTLQSLINAAAAGSAVTMTESVTLTKDFTVHTNKSLVIPDGITLTIASGTKLTNEGNIYVKKGGSLIVNEGGTYKDTTFALFKLQGGVFTVNGNVDIPANKGIIVDLYADTEYYESETAWASATNLDKDAIALTVTVADDTAIQYYLTLGYGNCVFTISNSNNNTVTLSNTTIPSLKNVNFCGTEENAASVNIPSGVTFTNNGFVTLNRCSMTVQKGGTYTGTQPTCYNGATYTDNNTLTSNDTELREDIEDKSANGGTVEVKSDVVLGSDLIVNAANGTLKLELTSGTLTIPEGKSLTIGANAQLILSGGKLAGDGTVNLEEGATVSFNADKYTTELFDDIVATKIGKPSVDYFGSFMDATTLNNHLSKLGFKSMNLVQTDNTNVALTENLTIPADTLVDVSDGSVFTVSGCTLTNEGTLQISGNAMFTVQTGAHFANNGSFKYDYYSALTINGTLSGTNVGDIKLDVYTEEALHAALASGATGITLYNRIMLSSDLTIPAGVNLCIADNAHLEVSGSNRALVNNGTVYVNGQIDVFSSLVNNGTLNIAGRVQIHNGGAFSGNEPAVGAYTTITNNVSTSEQFMLALGDNYSEINIIGDVAIDPRYTGLGNSEGTVINIKDGGTFTIPTGNFFHLYDTINLFTGGKLNVQSDAELIVHTKSDGDFPAIELLGGVLTVNGSIELPEGCASCTSFWAKNYTAVTDATNLPKGSVRYAAEASTGAQIKSIIDNTGFASYHIDINNVVTTESGKTNNVDLVSLTIAPDTDVTFRGLDKSCVANLYVNEGVTFDHGNGTGKIYLINCNLVINGGGSYVGSRPVPEINFIDNTRVVRTVTNLQEFNSAVGDASTVAIIVNGDITLDSNAMLPLPNREGVIDLTISSGSSFTIPSGKEMTVRGNIYVDGGTLNIQENATLILADSSHTQSYLYIWSGSVTNNGTFVPPSDTGVSYPYPNGKCRILLSEKNDSTPSSNFTALYTGDKSNVCISRTVASANDINTILTNGVENGFKNYFFDFDSDVSLAASVTIPEGVAVDFRTQTAAGSPNSTLTVPVDVSLINYGTLNSSMNITVVKGGTISGNLPTMLYNAVLTDNNDPAEDVLRDAIAEAAKTATREYPEYVELTRNVTLTKNLTLPAYVGLRISSGATLTIPNGKTFEAAYAVDVYTGGKIVVDKGGKFNATKCIVALFGGRIEVNGTLNASTGGTINVSIYADSYDSLAAIKNATNIPAEKIKYTDYGITEGQDIVDFLNSDLPNYAINLLYIENDIELPESITIPADMKVGFVGHYEYGVTEANNKLTVPNGKSFTVNGDIQINRLDVDVASGAEFANNGSSSCFNGSVITVGGSWTGNAPIPYGDDCLFIPQEGSDVSVSLTDGATLAMAINSGWKEITVAQSVTLGINATLPAGSTLKVDKGAVLTVPKGVKLTLGNSIDLSGTLAVSGEVSVADPAARINLKDGTGRVNVLSGGTLARPNGDNTAVIAYPYTGGKFTGCTSGVKLSQIEVTATVADEAELRDVLVTAGYQKAYITVNATKAIRLTQDLTVADGGFLTLKGGEITVAKGVTLTNNGKLTLDGTELAVEVANGYVEAENATLDVIGKGKFTVGGLDVNATITDEASLRSAIAAGVKNIAVSCADEEDSEITLTDDLEVPLGTTVTITNATLEVASGLTLTVKGCLVLGEYADICGEGTIDLTAAGDTPVLWLQGGNQDVTTLKTGKNTAVRVYGDNYVMSAFTSGSSAELYLTNPSADALVSVLALKWDNVVCTLTENVEGYRLDLIVKPQNVTFTNGGAASPVYIDGIARIELYYKQNITLDGVCLAFDDGAQKISNNTNFITKNGGKLTNAAHSVSFDGIVDSEADLVASLALFHSATLHGDITVTGEVSIEEYNGASYTTGMVEVPDGRTLTVANGGTLRFRGGMMDVYGKLDLKSGASVDCADSDADKNAVTVHYNGVVNNSGAAINSENGGMSFIVSPTPGVDYTKSVVGIPADLVILRVETLGMTDAEATKAIKTAISKGYASVRVMVESFTLTESITLPAATALELDSYSGAVITVPNGVTVAVESEENKIVSGVSFLVENGGEVDGNAIEFNSASAALTDMNDISLESQEVTTEAELRAALEAGVERVIVTANITIEGNLTIPYKSYIIVNSDVMFIVNGELLLIGSMGAQGDVKINNLTVRNYEQNGIYTLSNIALLGGELTVTGSINMTDAVDKRIVWIHADFYSTTAIKDLCSTYVHGVKVENVLLNKDEVDEKSLRDAMEVGFGAVSLGSNPSDRGTVSEITLTDDLTLISNKNTYYSTDYFIYYCSINVPEGIILKIDEKTRLHYFGQSIDPTEDAVLHIKKGGDFVNNGYVNLYSGAAIINDNVTGEYRFDGNVDTEADLRYALNAGFKNINIQSPITITENIDIEANIDLYNGGSLTVSKGVTVNLSSSVNINMGGTMTVQSGAMIKYVGENALIRLYGGRLTAPTASIVSPNNVKAFLYTDAYDNSNKYSSAISGLNKANILAMFDVTDSRSMLAALNAGYGTTQFYVPGNITLTGNFTFAAGKTVQFFGASKDLAVTLASGSTLTNNGTLVLGINLNIADGAKYVTGVNAVLECYDVNLNFIGDNSNACKHNWEKQDEQSVSATCETSGTRYDICRLCGETRTVTIPATGHNIKTLPGTPATCDTDGEKEARICLNCDYVTIWELDETDNVEKWVEKDFGEQEDFTVALADARRIYATAEHDLVTVTKATLTTGETKRCTLCNNPFTVDNAPYDVEIIPAALASSWSFPLTVNVNTANAPAGVSVDGEVTRNVAYGSDFTLTTLVTGNDDKDYVLEGWTVERSDGKVFYYGDGNGNAEGWYDPDSTGITASVVEAPDVESFTFDETSFTSLYDVPYTIDEDNDNVLCTENGDTYVSFTLNAVWSRNEKTITFERWTAVTDSIDENGNIIYDENGNTIPTQFVLSFPYASITRGMHEPIFELENEYLYKYYPTNDPVGYKFAGWQLVSKKSNELIGEVGIGDTLNDVLNGRELGENEELTLRVAYNPKSMCIKAESKNGSWKLYEDGRLEITSFADDGYKGYADVIKKVVFGEDVESVPDDAFKLNVVMFKCLEEVELNNVTSIGKNAFRNCYRLYKIDLSRVKYIDSQAFDGCTSLESVTLNSDITYIGSSAFASTGLKTVVLDLNNSRVIENQSGIFSKCKNLESVWISARTPTDGDSYISGSVFSGCTALAHVNINGFNGIGSYAFADCSSLKEINLYGVKYIADAAFIGCTNLSSVSFDSAMLGTMDDEENVDYDSLGYIGTMAFSGCTALKTVYLVGSPVQWTALKESGHISNMGHGNPNERLLSAKVVAKQIVKSISITNAPKYVGVGGTRTLTAKITPANAYPADVTWWFCDENGEVTYTVDESMVEIKDNNLIAKLNTRTGELTGIGTSEATDTVYIVAIANAYTAGEAAPVSAPIAVEVRDYGISTDEYNTIMLPDGDSEETKKASRYWFWDEVSNDYYFMLEANDKAQLTAEWNEVKGTKLVWSLDPADSLYASISSSGVITAKNVTKTVTVNAHVKTSDGQSLEATTPITIYPQPNALNVYAMNEVVKDDVYGDYLTYGADTVNGKTLVLDVKDFREGGKYYNNSESRVDGGLDIAIVSGPSEAMPIIEIDNTDSFLNYGDDFETYSDYEENSPCLTVKVKPIEPETDDLVGKTVKWTINVKNATGKRIASTTLSFKFVDQVTDLKPIDALDGEGYFEMSSGQKLTLKVASAKWVEDSNNQNGGYHEFDKLDSKNNPIVLTNKQVRYSIIKGENYATINSSGQITAKTVQEIKYVKVHVELIDDPSVCTNITVGIYPLITNIQLLSIMPTEGEELFSLQPVNDAKLFIDTDSGDEINITARFTPEQAGWRWNIKDVINITQKNPKAIELAENHYTVGEESIPYYAVSAKPGAKGSDTITLSATDGSKKSAKLTVSVDDFVNTIAIDGYTYDNDKNNWLDEEGKNPIVKSGGRLNLKAKAYSDDEKQTLSKTGVSFALENPADSAYATVSSSGTVTAKTTYGYHDVAIIATAKDAKAVSTRIVVTVEPKDPGILTIENDAEENITKTTQLMDIGDEENVSMLSLFAVDLDGARPKVTWKSSNSSVASVDPDSGIVVANKLGTATITATVADESRPNDKRTATVTVKVTRFVKEIELRTAKNEDAVIISGKSINLKAVVTPTNASSKAVTWSIVSGAEYATVSSSGSVKANKGIVDPYTVTVMATAKDGSGVSATFDIEILPETTGIGIMQSGVNIENTTFQMHVSSNAENNDSIRFLAITYPEGASDKVKWKSSNTKVATVDENGVVTAVKPGTVTITVESTDGSKKSASFKLTVTQPVEALSLKLGTKADDPVINETVLGAGRSITFRPNIEPANATNKKLTWSVEAISGDLGATVSSNGVLKAANVTGECVVEVTATAQDGSGQSASCMVVIKPLVTSVELYYGSDKINGKQLDLWQGDSLTISASNLPVVATQGWTWRSSNTAIATVEPTSTGVIVNTAESTKTGTVTITATANDGSNRSANFKVKVAIPVSEIKLNVADTFSIAEGKSVTLKATTNTDATNKRVNWSIISGGDFATINSSGVLKANASVDGEETVTVVATAADGSGTTKEVTATITPAVDKVYIFDEGNGVGENLPNVTGQTLDLAVNGALQLKNKNTSKSGDEIDVSQINTWKSSNTGIATVDESGKVTALKPGTVTITSTSTDGTNRSATVKVKVVQPVTGITIEPPAAMKISDGGSVYLASGKSMTFKATVIPSNATNKSLEWSVDSTDDATIKNGTLTAKSAGSVVEVTATAKDGSNVSATFTVQTTAPTTKVQIKHDDVDVTGKTLQLPINSESGFYLDAAFNEGAWNTSQTAKWKSSNTSIATVEEIGEFTYVKPTGNKTGTVTITATAVDGTNKSATVKVNVFKPVTDITITAPNDASGNERTVLASGKSMTLKAAVNSDASNKGITWSVDNTDAAKIASNGSITAKNVTEATEVTVTATAKDGNAVTETKKITVYPATTAVELTNDEITLKSSTTLDLPTNGEHLTIMAENTATNVTPYQGWTWKSSNANIAAVTGTDNGATVEFADKGKTGTVTITATANDGTNKSASFKVRVYTPVEGIDITAPNMVGDTATVATGKSVRLTANVNADATNKAVTWRVIEGSQFISVNSSGTVSVKSAAMKFVTATWVEAVVQATAKDGSEMADEITVRVYKSLAQKITVARPAAATSNTLTVGSTMQLSAACYSDSKGTKLLDEAPVMWRSSNESIATVDGNGNVTAVKPGYVIITAVTADGGNKSATIGLTVIK